MFIPDVVNLREFYNTSLGRAAQTMLAAAIYHLWPHAHGDLVIGLGYGLPYLETYVGQSTPVAVCMPAGQGAIYWPPKSKNVVFLSHESKIPLAENSVNRILLVHSVEHTETLSGLMQEVWRVLTPGGRVLAIVPNRLGVWSRSPRSPFGYGRPFSMAQLRDLLSEHQFTLTRSGSALFMWPTHSRWLWRMAPRLEKIGRILCPFLGGVLLLEAEKQLYATIKQPVHARQGYRIAVPSTTPAVSR